MEEESYAMFIQSVAEQVLDEEDQYRYKRLTSFLQVDRSFLTPWSGNPSSFGTTGDVRPSMRPKEEFMRFQPGSFFSYEIGNFMGKACTEEENGASEKKKQSVCSSPSLCKDHPSSLAMVGGNGHGHMKPVLADEKIQKPSRQSHKNTNLLL